MTAAELEEEPFAVLVSRDGRPLRLEVRRGEVVEEVHELDDAGRVLRSLYRAPRPDGAVEVRRERDDTGAITQVVRVDRRGLVVG